MTASRLITPGKPVASALNRAPFVVLLIALLGAGIAGVLYLNTMTDEAGMRTSTAKIATTDLRLQIESLQRDVALLDATPRIADAASKLGMVPAGDSAMLMINGAGQGSVVGEPSQVQGPPPPPPAPSTPAATKPAASKPAATKPATTTPAASAPAASAPAASPPATAAGAAAGAAPGTAAGTAPTTPATGVQR
jgi:hypothetical protein